MVSLHFAVMLMLGHLAEMCLSRVSTLQLLFFSSFHTVLWEEAATHSPCLRTVSLLEGEGIYPDSFSIVKKVKTHS